MDYKDLGEAKALSARLMPELQEKTRVSAVTCSVGGVQATATYARGVLSRVQRSGGIKICVQAARAPRNFRRQSGHMIVPIKLLRG